MNEIEETGLETIILDKYPDNILNDTTNLDSDNIPLIVSVTANKNKMFGSISNQYNKTIDLVVSNTVLNKAFVAGTITSIIFNGVSSYYANKHGFSNYGIGWTSYFAEIVSNGLVTTPIIVNSLMKKGKTMYASFKELSINVAPVAFALSIFPYSLVRNAAVDCMISAGIPPQGATPTAQLLLLFPYLALVYYAQDYIKKYRNKSTIKIIG